MTFTVLKMYFEKPKPKMDVYRDYKNSSNKRFCLEFLFRKIGLPMLGNIVIVSICYVEKNEDIMTN